METSSQIHKQIEHLFANLLKTRGGISRPRPRWLMAGILFGQRIVMLDGYFLEKCLKLPSTASWEEVMRHWNACAFVHFRETYLPVLDELEWRTALRISDRVVGESLLLHSLPGRSESSCERWISRDWRNEPHGYYHGCANSNDALWITLRFIEAVELEIPFSVTGVIDRPSKRLSSGRVRTGAQAVPEILVEADGRIVLRFVRMRTIEKVTRILLKIGECGP